MNKSKTKMPMMNSSKKGTGTKMPPMMGKRAKMPSTKIMIKNHK